MSEKFQPLQFIGDAEMLKKISPLAGYAHGGYTNKCASCGEQFIGEKRAFMCLPCAVKSISDQRPSVVKPLECRPMDSAPLDGTGVVLKVERRAGIPGCYLVGHFMEGGHCIEDHPPIDRGWYFWNGLMFDKAAEPIGWLPLSALEPGSNDALEEAATTILADDIALSRMAEAMHNGPLCADEYAFSAAHPSGEFCLDMARAGLRALKEQSDD